MNLIDALRVLAKEHGSLQVAVTMDGHFAIYSSSVRLKEKARGDSDWRTADSATIEREILALAGQQPEASEAEEAGGMVRVSDTNYVNPAFIMCAWWDKTLDGWALRFRDNPNMNVGYGTVAPAYEDRVIAVLRIERPKE
jgi:hypothetical protein